MVVFFFVFEWGVQTQKIIAGGTLGWTLGGTRNDKEKPNVLVGWTLGWTLLTKLKVLSRVKWDKNKGKNGKNNVLEGQNASKNNVFGEHFTSDDADNQ